MPGGIESLADVVRPGREYVGCVCPGQHVDAYYRPAGDPHATKGAQPRLGRSAASPTAGMDTDDGTARHPHRFGKVNTKPDAGKTCPSRRIMSRVATTNLARRAV